MVTIVGGLTGVSLAIDDVSTQGWTSAVTLIDLIGGIALLVAFCAIEKRVSVPLVRPSLLRNRLFVVLSVAGTLANIGSCVFIVCATLELQDVRGSRRPLPGWSSSSRHWAWPCAGRSRDGSRSAIRPGW